MLFNIVTNGSVLDGRVQGENPWTYEFAERQGVTYTFYIWEVWSSGEVRFSGPLLPVLRWEFSDLAPTIALDSDSAVQLARSYGAERYLRSHPDARARPLSAMFLGVSRSGVLCFT